MLSHKKIWSAIDKIAKEASLTPSGLAKKAGLDPTSFNKSKRIGKGGKLRWPSTESLYKILKVLNKDLSYFSSLVEPESFSEVAIIGSVNNDSLGFAEDSNQAEKLAFPRALGNDDIAIKIKGYSLEPIYRNNDILIASKKDNCFSEYDRVIIQTKEKDILIKEFSKKDKEFIVVREIDPEKKGITQISLSDISWIGKITWVKQ